MRGLALAGAAALTAAAMMALAYLHPRGSRGAVEPAWIAGPPSLQDSLFRLHPDYPGE